VFCRWQGTQSLARRWEFGIAEAFPQWGILLCVGAVHCGILGVRQFSSAFMLLLCGQAEGVPIDRRRYEQQPIHFDRHRFAEERVLLQPTLLICKP
jgi:hypothetical protein